MLGQAAASGDKRRQPLAPLVPAPARPAAAAGSSSSSAARAAAVSAAVSAAGGSAGGGSAAGGSAPSLFSWALVCACNMNRSPSGHAELSRRGQARVSSFGTSDAVRLPGRTGMHQFAFGVRYADMLARMLAGERANAAWMAAYGIAAMLQRNAALKPAPEAWAAAPLAAVRALDFAICFDSAVYAAVLADLARRAAQAPPMAGHDELARLLPAGACGASWALLAADAGAQQAAALLARH